MVIIDETQYKMNENYHQATYPQQSTRNITENSELGDALKELNNDSIEQDTRMSGIDLRARLHFAEIPSILGMDALVQMKILPIVCLGFTRQKKRLSVSIQGQGREDIVRIVSGKKESDIAQASGGFMDRIKGFVGAK